MRGRRGRGGEAEEGEKLGWGSGGGEGGEEVGNEGRGAFPRGSGGGGGGVVNKGEAGKRIGGLAYSTYGLAFRRLSDRGCIGLTSDLRASLIKFSPSSLSKSATICIEIGAAWSPSTKAKTPSALWLLCERKTTLTRIHELRMSNLYSSPLQHIRQTHYFERAYTTPGSREDVTVTPLRAAWQIIEICGKGVGLSVSQVACVNLRKVA